MLKSSSLGNVNVQPKICHYEGSIPDMFFDLHLDFSFPALVGALAIGMTFFTSAVAGVLTDHLGIMTTALFGGFLAAGGMLSSYFFCESVSKSSQS